MPGSSLFRGGVGVELAAMARPNLYRYLAHLVVSTALAAAR